MPLLAFWPLRCSQACDHERMMQGGTIRDSSLAAKMGGRHVLGVDFLVFPRNSSNSLDQQGINASCTPKMRSCFYRVSR